MTTVRLACEAMATRFELVLQGEDEVWLRAAGEEALAEIKRLEAQLSFFRPSSEISRINARAASEPVQVEPRLFQLLQTAKRVWRDSGGAFDPTIAPLMRAWGFTNGPGSLPTPEAWNEARSRTGMDLVHLNPDDCTVSFERAGVLLDLGAIGKGYAVEEAAVILTEAGGTRAFLHGGTSTIYALGRPLDGESWQVGIEHPDAPGDDLLAVVRLENEALSVSAVWGKAFMDDGKHYGHVLDPRSGRPVEGAVLAAVAVPSATDSDAWSTALLVLGRSGADLAARKGMRTLLLIPDETTGRLELVPMVDSIAA